MNAKRTTKFIAASVMFMLVFSGCAELLPGSDADLEQQRIETAVALTIQAQQPAAIPATSTPAPAQPAATLVPTLTPFQPAGLNPTSTLPAPAGQTGMSGTANATCPNPGDLEVMPRSTVDQAVAGQWFHPIFDVTDYQSSGGYEGQMSWANTLCLLPSSGGFFKHFEGDDGEFVFRMNTTQAHVAFAVLSTSEYANQFLEGADYPIALNIRAMPGTTVNVTDHNGKTTSQAVSIAGDITVILPSDGVTTFAFDVTDPATTFEVKFWFGPYDRSEKINTIDAR